MTAYKKLLHRIGDVIQANADRQIVEAISKVYGLKVAGAGLAYVVQVAVAFYLGAANYGIFALAWTIATMLGQLCCCGFNDTIGRFLPTYVTREDLPQARGFVHFVLRFTAYVSISVSAFIATALVFARELLPEAYLMPILIGLACVPVLVFTHLKESLAINRSLVIRGLYPSYILRPLLLILFTALVANLTGVKDGSVAVTGLLIAAIGAAVLQSVLMAKPLRGELGEGARTCDRSMWLRTSLPLLLAQGFFVLTTNVDVIILSYFVPAADLGIYFAAMKIATLLSFVHIAVASGLTRRLSESVARNDWAGFDDYFRRGRLWMLIPTVPGAAFLYFGSPLLLAMFGAEFVAGAAVVTVLTTGVLAQALGGPVQEALIVSGHQKQVSMVLTISFAINIALSITLAASFGMMGVAIASMLSITGRICAMTVLAQLRRRAVWAGLQPATGH